MDVVFVVVVVVVVVLVVVAAVRVDDTQTGNRK